MNKRIKEFAMTSGILTLLQASGVKERTVELVVEDFAEQILTDCLAQCQNYGGDASLVANHVARKIKDHFGLPQ